MTDQDETTTTKVLRGMLAGTVAGVAASFAMDRFQAAVTALAPDDSGDDDDDAEPATAKTADAIVTNTTGGEIPDADKPLAGQAVHYVLGVGLGVLYGIAAEFRPAVTAGYGTAFGIGTATLLDEAAVPAAGLGDAPWRSPPVTHLYSYASHLVFGGVSELVRRQVAGTLTK